MQSSRPTIRQIAVLAKVSPTTVSDALRGSGRVHARTRDRIVGIADQIGYRHSHAARTLREGAPASVSLYVNTPNMTDHSGNPRPYHSRLILALTDLLATSNFRMRLRPFSVLTDSPEKVDDDVLVGVADEIPPSLVQTLIGRSACFIACSAEEHEAYPASTVRLNLDHYQMVTDALRSMDARVLGPVAFIYHEIQKYDRAAVAAYKDWCEAQGWTPRLLETTGMTSKEKRESVASFFDAHEINKVLNYDQTDEFILTQPRSPSLLLYSQSARKDREEAVDGFGTLALLPEKAAAVLATAIVNHRSGAPRVVDLPYRIIDPL